MSSRISSGPFIFLLAEVSTIKDPVVQRDTLFTLDGAEVPWLRLLDSTEVTWLRLLDDTEVLEFVDPSAEVGLW